MAMPITIGNYSSIVMAAQAAIHAARLELHNSFTWTAAGAAVTAGGF